MNPYTEGCLICGKPLVYFEAERQAACHICGGTRRAHASCEDGHFVCDACHAGKGTLWIERIASKTRSKDPVSIAAEMMLGPEISLHGPEHHILIAAALLAAYRNAGGQVEMKEALQSVLRRAREVPGGICGRWGSCGAAVASGIFVSVITGATPLSEREWSLANAMTAKSLAAIAAHGGPRCCKRNTFLAITQAVEFVSEHLGITMERPERIVCTVSHRNQHCRRERCLYHSTRVLRPDV